MTAVTVPEDGSLSLAQGSTWMEGGPSAPASHKHAEVLTWVTQCTLLSEILHCVCAEPLSNCASWDQEYGHSFPGFTKQAQKPLMLASPSSKTNQFCGLGTWP